MKEIGKDIFPITYNYVSYSYQIQNTVNLLDNVPGTEEINVEQKLNIVRYNKAIFIVISVKLLHFRHFSTILKEISFLY